MSYRRKRQTKKIVLIPGVGFHEDLHPYDEFLKRFRDEFGCDTEIFNWNHEWNMPRDTDLSFMGLRNLVCEVILDFQQIVRHCYDMEVPPADLYIAHSAGSILALLQKNTPCIIFGSPAALVENIKDRYMELYAKMIKAQRPILNLINTTDVIAYPLSWANVENYYYKPLIPNPLSLVTAHTSYWKNKKMVNKMVATIKQWGVLG